MVDYPTTGGWGQTDKQWRDGKTAYEIAKERENKLRDEINYLDQQIEAAETLGNAAKMFLAVCEGTLSKGEITSLERQILYIVNKLSHLATRRHNAANEMKIATTKTINRTRSR